MHTPRTPSEVEAVARRAIDAINDRTLPARANELLDPFLVRHDLVHLFPDSEGLTGGSDFVGMILVPARCGMARSVRRWSWQARPPFRTVDRAAARGPSVVSSVAVVRSPQ